MSDSMDSHATFDGADADELPDYMLIKDRPIGVTILAVLHLIGAVVLGVGIAILSSRQEEIAEALRQIGIPLWMLAAGVALLAVLAAASGIGMLIGAKWGWWFAAIWYAYAITRAASALVLVFQVAGHIDDGTRSAGYYYAKFAGRIVVSGLLLVYLLRDRVLEYFRLSSLSKAQALLTLLGICAAIWLALNVPSLLSAE